MPDIVLFDSFNDIDKVLRLKKCYPTAYFVHRVNGPISLYRGQDYCVDYLIQKLAEHLADAVIFQSDYSKKANIKLGMQIPAEHRVIPNGEQELSVPAGRRTLIRALNITSTSMNI